VKVLVPALALLPLLFVAKPADACAGEKEMTAKKGEADAVERASFALVHTATIKVDGMSCGSCTKGLARALERQAGVVEAKVVFKDKNAVVTFDPSATDAKKLIGVLTSEGEYKAELAKDGLVAHAHLLLDRPSKKVEGALKGLAGVTAVKLDDKSNRTHVDFDPAKTKPDVIISALAKAGFKARLPEKAKS
jgi:copper chaperone CopZ